ncbi:MAG: Uma2 family endonuclease [Actinomycetota bacterium]|nr:Uma2 family endonuclease [Actinomycetota bacterium]
MAAIAPALHRLTYDDVVRMYEAGILGENARVELLDGLLIDLVPPGPHHDGRVVRLNKRFVKAVPDAYEVRPQLVLRLAGGDFVLPDLMVVDAVEGVDRQPTTAALVIEVAHTSQRHDREKATRYAAAGVVEYWIADVVGRAVTVYRDPSADGYATVTEHRDGTLVPLIGTPEVPVSELLGPPPPLDQA